MAKDKIKLYKNGAWVTMDCAGLQGMTTVKCYAPNGELHDKIRCDMRQQANEYYKVFCAIAKNNFK